MGEGAGSGRRRRAAGAGPQGRRGDGDVAAGAKGESRIVAECLIALSRCGARVWRNNTGRLKNESGRLVTFGLCVGSSDIIGIAPDGRFLAVECKTERGQPTTAQTRFLDVIRRRGGRAGIARSPEDAVRLATDPL